MDGGNLLGRWTHRFSDEASFQFQTYYDRTHRDAVIFSEQRDTFDVDFQNRFRPCARNSVVWGLGYRLTSDDTGITPTVALRPPSRNLNLFSGFLQDEIAILEDKLKFTIGSKIEHNDFTGWEVQPSARLLWTPVTNHTFWASVNRAVRTPSRAENDAVITAVVAPGAAVALFGSHEFESEKLMAYELGYRLQPLTQVSFDTALFFNDYDDLRTLEFLNPSQVPAPLSAAQVARNRMHGETYGAELAANWQPLDWWRFRASYTYFQMDLHRDASSNNRANESIEGQSPHHQFSIRSGINLPHNVEFDAALRYVDALGALSVPSYFSLDLRLSWRPIEKLEVAIIGRDLLDQSHPEFNPTTIRAMPAEAERAVFGKLTWFF